MGNHYIIEQNEYEEAIMIQPQPQPQPQQQPQQDDNLSHTSAESIQIIDNNEWNDGEPNNANVLQNDPNLNIHPNEPNMNIFPNEPYEPFVNDGLHMNDGEDQQDNRYSSEDEKKEKRW